jgi:hypothetical protein
LRCIQLKKAPGPSIAIDLEFRLNRCKSSVIVVPFCGKPKIRFRLVSQQHESGEALTRPTGCCAHARSRGQLVNIRL